MNDHELNEKINGAFTRATPDVLDSVRSRCLEQKGTVIYMTQPNKKGSLARRFAAVAAAVVLVAAAAIGAGSYRAGHTVAATVSLDINPSVEIQVNKDETVLDVIPLNEDGKTVVGTMDFKGSSLEVTVNALIGSILRNGYLSELSNSILVTVDDDDAARGQALENRLATVISELLHTGSFDGAVLSQTIDSDTEPDMLADQYGVTAGKARLIRQIVAQDPRYTAEDLVGLSINELNLILTTGSMELDQITSSGSASEKAYVGREAAIEAACAHAGVARPAYVECELDWEHGRMIYEIEFIADGAEYEYDVDANTGEVLAWELDDDDDDRGNGNGYGGNGYGGNGSAGQNCTFIGGDTAKAAALTHAGVNAADAYDWECELDEDDGVYLYEIEFKSENYEYSYEINACTGAVLEWEKEYDD